jgi:hypothetical protein
MNFKLPKQVCVAVILCTLLISTPVTFSNFNAYAQSTKLIVSAAQDPAQQNHFFGPQIVQIIIDDPGARDPDRSTGALTVKGMSMQRVHLTNGLWYSFIAEDDSFLVFLDIMTDGARDNIIAVSDPDDADNRNAIGSINMQFANADSFVREITDVGGNIFVEVTKNAIFPSLPDPFGGVAINPDVDVNSSTEAAADWPYIRLFNIQETDIVDIRIDVTSTSLTFNTLFSYIEMGLDRETYPLNSEVIMHFKDFMWNINPVEEDVVRFVLDKNNGRPVKVLYEPIRNFDPDGLGLTGENMPDLLPAFAFLEFDNRQVLEIDGIGNLKYKQAFDGTLIEFPEESGKLITDFTTSQLPVVTFIEKDPNISLFESVDESQGSRSKVFAGKRDATASIDYFDIIDTVVSGINDGFVTIDKEIYDSADRATFSVTDRDLNSRSLVSESLDGVLSKAFVNIGTPFPITNNALFNTLPKDLNGNFAVDSIREVRFVTVGPGAEVVDFDQNGVNDFFAPSGNIEDRSPAKSDFLALDFTTDSASGTSGAAPTGFIAKTNVKLADIDDVVTFTMTKDELLNSADPFIRAVSRLVPVEGGTFGAAALDDKINVSFPKYNLIHVDLRKLQGQFAKVFVEVEASDGFTTVARMVDFEPFDPQDVDGNPGTLSINPLTDTSGTGSFRALDLVDAFPPATNLNNVLLKFTVILTDSANQPVPITAASHVAVLDVGGLGVVRAIGSSIDAISLTAFENFVYRLELDEVGENSGTFNGRADFMTVLQSDTVQRVLDTIVETGDPLKIWLPNRFIPPSRLALAYTDLDVNGAFRQVSATFVYETRDPKVSWDQGQYRFNQEAILTVVDEDLNRKPDAIEQYPIPQDGFLFFEFDKKRADTQCQTLTPIPKECFVNFVEATLRETGPNTSVFKAQIKLPERVLLEDGSIIRTIKSDIQANYVDVRDSSSNVQQFDATAVIRSDIDTTPVQPEPSPEQPTVVEKGSTKLELNKGNYHPYDRVEMIITSPEGNVDIFRSDVIFISAKRQSSAIGITSYKLVETGVNTSVFTGYIDLQGNSGKDGGVGPKDGTMKIDVGDSLIISYAAVAATVPIEYHVGKIFWDKGRYVAGEKAKLHLIDPDLSKDADISEIAHVQLLIGNAKVQADLRENDVNSGVFEGEILFADISKPAKPLEVPVKSGDVVTAVYIDATVPLSALQGSTEKTLSIEASTNIGDILEIIGTNRVVQTESKLVDENGDKVDMAKSLRSYKIQSNVYNNTTESLTFAFIVQITDEDGIIEFLEYVTQTAGPEESITPVIDWQAMKKGRHAIEIFAWQNLDAPSPLSPVRKVNVTVE